MTIDEPHVTDQLAAEYVLGTLQGRARRRFEGLIRRAPVVRRQVWAWEGRLGLLVQGVEPVQPRPTVWRRIHGRIAPARPDGWRWTLVPMAALLLLGAVGGWLIGPSAPTAERLALIDSESGQPLWLIKVDLDSGRLEARALNAVATDVDRVFELWALGVDGRPRSLGILPVSGGDERRELPAGLSALLHGVDAVAVSIEPSGGSPTGAPTGPVVYQEPLVKL